MLYSVTIETLLGPMTAYASKHGLCTLEFSPAEGNERLTGKIANQEVIYEANSHLKNLEHELKEYFDGKRKKFSIPLDAFGTPFQKTVWEELLKIPYGETRSYMQQSIAVGNPKSIRAVASANGQNKIAILIPCHRVIGDNGSLTGYAGGLNRKKWLLDHERKFSGQPIQGELFQ